MKKTIILFLSFFLFTSYSFAFNESKIVNTLKTEFKKLNYEKLDDINYRLNKIKNKYSDGEHQKLFSKISEILKNEIWKKVVYTEYDYVLDFDDDKNMMWFSDNVFVAKVVKRLWQINPWKEFNDFSPETIFNLEVLYNIKWNIKWNIKANFEWWYDKKWILYIPDWQKFPKEKGIYLMVTMWNNYNISTHPNWFHLISLDNNISKTKTKNLIKENKKVQDFIKAYTLSPYYKTKNAYKDLSKKEKENLKNFENWFVNELRKIK